MDLPQPEAASYCHGVGRAGLLPAPFVSLFQEASGQPKHRTQSDLRQSNPASFFLCPR